MSDLGREIRTRQKQKERKKERKIERKKEETKGVGEAYLDQTFPKRMRAPLNPTFGIEKS